MLSRAVCLVPSARHLRISRPVPWTTIAASFAVPAHQHPTLDLDHEHPVLSHRHVRGPYDRETYEKIFKESIEDPEGFWARQAEHIEWYKPWDRVLDNSNAPFTRWFPGGELNTCHNALDRHVTEEGKRKNQLAIIHDSPVTHTVTRITYGELLEQVSLFAGVLKDQGVKLGDRVLIYMPMIPQAMITMLACARLGAIHSVVFGGFAAKELAVRIDHCKPKVLVTASAGVEPSRIQEYKPIVDQACEIAQSKVKSVIVYQRKDIGTVKYQADRDFDWEHCMNSAKPAPCVPVSATDPLYVLYTSGTTGTPKGVVRPSGGHAVILPWSMQTIYGLEPGETWWANSDLGWVVGHSYICYAPLIYGCTTVLYEGKPNTPDTSAYFRVLSEHNVKSMFVAPTALRAIRQADNHAYFGAPYVSHGNWNVRALFAAGEHLDYETRDWAESHFKVPVLDHWWQTESGYPITAVSFGCESVNTNPPKDTSGMPVPGWNVQVIDDQTGKQLPAETLGRIVVKMPLPPGSLSTFWQNDEKFANTYFKQFADYYDTQDAGKITEDGYLCVMSRVDDVINVAGHRISGGAIEEAIMEHDGVVECAVIPVADQLKGSMPMAFCVIRADFHEKAEETRKEIIQLVRDIVGPVAALKKILLIPALPKTRSGKIARNTLTAMAAGKPFKIPVTIEDAGVYEKIEEIMVDAGFPKASYLQ